MDAINVNEKAVERLKRKIIIAETRTSRPGINPISRWLLGLKSRLRRKRNVTRINKAGEFPSVS